MPSVRERMVPTCRGRSGVSRESGRTHPVRRRAVSGYRVSARPHRDAGSRRSADMRAVRDVGAAADPVAAVLEAHDRDELIALRTSGTTNVPRAVVRTTGSWVDSFPHV